MKKLLKLGLLAIVILVLPAPVSAPREEIRLYDSRLYLDYRISHEIDLRELANRYGLTRLIQCESGWNENAIGQQLEIGLLQFKHQTFYHFAKIYKITEPDIYNSYQQIMLAQMMIRDNRGNHWACIYRL